MRLVQSLKLVQGPTDEPVSLTEAKVHLRVDQAEDDGWIRDAISSARGTLETMAQRLLCLQTWKLSLSRFPDGTRRSNGDASGEAGQEGDEICLQYAGVFEVSSITYVDTNGAEQTLATTEYTVDLNREPARVQPAYGKSWPACREQPNAVNITFRGGEDDVEQLDKRVKQAVYMLVAHWYANRETVLTGTISKELEFSLAHLARQLWPGRLA